MLLASVARLLMETEFENKHSTLIPLLRRGALQTHAERLHRSGSALVHHVLAKQTIRFKEARHGLLHHVLHSLLADRRTQLEHIAIRDGECMHLLFVSKTARGLRSEVLRVGVFASLG